MKNQVSCMAMLIVCVSLQAMLISSLTARACIRFANEEQLLVANDKSLLVWNVVENKYYDDTLPSVSCNLLYDYSTCMISIIDNNHYQELWRLDWNEEPVIWKKINLCEVKSEEISREKWNKEIAMYASPNGCHVVRLGTYEETESDCTRKHRDRYQDCSKKGIVYTSADSKFVETPDAVEWDFVSRIYLSNDGQVVFVNIFSGYNGSVLLHGKNDTNFEWCPRIPSASGWFSCSALSSDGRFALIRASDVLGLFNMRTKQYVALMCCDEQKKALSICSKAEKDEPIDLVSAEFSEDGNRLLLLTHNNDDNICMQVFDIKSQAFIFEAPVKEDDARVATISPLGNRIATISKQGVLACFPVCDDVKQLISQMCTLSLD